MTKDKIIHGISASWRFLSALKLEQTFANYSPLSLSREFLDKALDPECGLEQLYLTGLSNVDYNIQLIDFSYLQFGMLDERKIRYSFYPNPFLGNESGTLELITEMSELVEQGEVSIDEYLQLVAEHRSSVYPPVLRYEYAPDSYEIWKHPASHFHIGQHGESRWPVRRMLTPLAFTMFVCKLFYSKRWHKNDEIELNGIRKNIEQYYIEQRTHCPELEDEHFDPEERRQFKFE